MSIALGESDYRSGGLERMHESEILRRAEYHGGCVYLAGRAVESMLRAVIWKFDLEIRSGRESLDTGHDLRELLGLVKDLGVLREDEQRDEFARLVQRIGQLWLNNMRFFSSRRLESHWRKLGEIRRGVTLKQAVLEYYNACVTVVRRCDLICRG